MLRKLTIIAIIFLTIIYLSGCSSNSDVKTVSATHTSTPQVTKNIEAPTKKPTPATKSTAIPSKVAISGVPVLMYHSISYVQGNEVRLPKEKFKEQMQFLKDNHYNTISLDELYSFLKNNVPLPSKPIVITFDDGYVDNYTTALPILKSFGFKAVVFVITNRVDKNPLYMTSKQLKEMLAAGIEIESHTVSHADLNFLSNIKQQSELDNSKSFLEKDLNSNVKYIAYPYGHFNINSLKGVQNAGYRMAFTTEKGWASKSDSLFELPRVYISSFFDINVFKERVTNPNYSTNVSVSNQSEPIISEAKVPINLNDLYTKGYKQFKAKNYKEAIATENAVIKIDSKFYKAYNVKGIAICFSSSFSEGMKYINKALELKPNYGYALFNKALAYELYRYFDEALIWYDNALKVEDYVWSYYGKASIYGRRGDVANTVLYLKKAIAIDDYARLCAKTEKDFDNVRNSKEFQDLMK